MASAQQQLNRLSQRFIAFGRDECAGYDPLYEQLSYAIANNSDLLELASYSRPGQPIPNLFFGAVQYLLLDQPGHHLDRYYASLTNDPQPPSEAFPSFRSFCLENRDDLLGLLQTRLVQTNELGRSATLPPALGLIQRLGGGRLLALVEVGSSAGLNLTFDRYFIDYGSQTWGNPDSAVRLHCELRGLPLPLEAGRPQVGYRTGLDLNLIDATDAEAMRWLRALVWPQYPERAAAMQSAIKLAQAERPRQFNGDANELLPGVLAEVPAELTLCVYHSHVINQFSAEARARFFDLLSEASAKRDVFELHQHGDAASGTMHARLDLTHWHRCEPTESILASVHAHGRWLDWRSTT